MEYILKDDYNQTTITESSIIIKARTTKVKIVAFWAISLICSYFYLKSIETNILLSVTFLISYYLFLIMFTFSFREVKFNKSQKMIFINFGIFNTKIPFLNQLPKAYCNAKFSVESPEHGLSHWSININSGCKILHFKNENQAKTYLEFLRQSIY